MAKKSNQPAYGRYDIVVFENGGWECIGKQASVPPAPEELYRPKVIEYVNSLAMSEQAGKYSMTYSYEDGACTVSWTPIK